MNEVANVDNQDEFDEIFFSKHGVGDTPQDNELEAMAHRLDPNQPTYTEVQFVKLILKGMERKRAYIQAFGYEGTEMKDRGFREASLRLLRRPRVAKKMYELQQMIREAEDEDLSKLIKELNDDRKLARDLGQPTAAIAAVKAKANLLGLDTVSSTTNIKIDISDEQRAQLVDRVKSRLNKPVIDAEYTEVTDE